MQRSWTIMERPKGAVSHGPGGVGTGRENGLRIWERRVGRWNTIEKIMRRKG
jgi:hypothetical protein